MKIIMTSFNKRIIFKINKHFTYSLFLFSVTLWWVVQEYYHCFLMDCKKRQNGMERGIWEASPLYPFPETNGNLCMNKESWVALWYSTWLIT